MKLLGIKKNKRKINGKIILMDNGKKGQKYILKKFAKSLLLGEKKKKESKMMGRSWVQN